MVMMVWQAELHQGKKSIILDAKKPAAREVTLTLTLDLPIPPRSLPISPAAREVILTLALTLS